MSRIHILNATIDNLSMNETLGLVQETIAAKKQIHHVVVNAGKIVQMQKDLQLRESVNSSDVINADGQAVVWAA
ncbi:MAG: N-acetylglucosaminyldiphosphoundecaprenol N-acetyl-beta-D-mannosaminyltransferase, partial [Saprospiraceae bacterium]